MSTRGSCGRGPRLRIDSWEAVEAAVQQLAKVKAAGVETIVDAAPADLGRNVEVAAEASRRSGVNIVCLTGQYSYYRMPWFENEFVRYDPDDLAELFVCEIEDGIRNTDVKAGLINVATPAHEMGASAEIERTVNSHPLVSEGAAVGVPSELGAEEVVVHVVVLPGSDLEPSELTRYCAERMAPFIVPRYVRIRVSLPKTATERVQKFTLRDEGTSDAWDSLAGPSE